jgi:hypothetical protein
MLHVYRPGSPTPTAYVPATDGRIRESPSPDSPRLPAFQAIANLRNRLDRLNVFLVVLNAEIKFSRHFRNNPRTPLPADVLELMRLTVELVDLLYWKPVLRKGSRGEGERTKSRRKNPGRQARPDRRKLVEVESSEDEKMEVEEDEDNSEFFLRL